MKIELSRLIIILVFLFSVGAMSQYCDSIFDNFRDICKTLFDKYRSKRKVNDNGK